MAEVGIVRRMDELGRIVIPKEIRRSLRLKVGDEMEIIPCGDGLRVKKHMRFDGMAGTVDGVVRALAEATGCTAVAVCADKVVAAAGKGAEGLEGVRAAEEFSELVTSRGGAAIGREREISVNAALPAFRGLAARPIVQAGDIIGGVALLGEKAATHADLVGFAASALALGDEV